MTASRSAAVALLLAAGLAACSKPATSTTTTTTQASSPVGAATTPVAAATLGTAAAPGGVASSAPAASAAANGYSCSFPGPGGQTILARFTLDGAGAHDDQGLPFTVLTDSPTALVLAHARDDLATAPTGDVGAYVVAIDRRSLGMVQTTVGLNGPGSTRHGRCISG